MKRRISRGTSQAERWIGLGCGWLIACFGGFMIYNAQTGNAWRAILNFAAMCFLIGAMLFTPPAFDGDDPTDAPADAHRGGQDGGGGEG